MPERRKLSRTELRRRKQIYFRRRVLVAVIFVLFLMLIYFIISGIVSLFAKGGKSSPGVSAQKPSSSASSSVVNQSSAASQPTSSMPAASVSPEQAASIVSKLSNLTQSSEWNLLLVSDKFLLAPNFKVATAKSTQIDAVMDSRVIESLDKMIAEAKKNQIYLASSSATLSYRSLTDSEKLFDNKVEEFKKQGMPLSAAQLEALKTTPQSGTSEHNAGLGLDLVTQDYLNGKLNESSDLSSVKEYVWLNSNCASFGFIPRYPKEKAAVTGVAYEPFHYRYVGVEHAQKIMKNNLCLEEYLIKLQNGEKLE